MAGGHRRGGGLGLDDGGRGQGAAACLRQCRDRCDLGRHQIGAPGLEEADRLVVEKRAVFDRIDPRLERGAGSLGRVAVRRDLAAEHVRGVDDRAHLVRGHRAA